MIDWYILLVLDCLLAPKLYSLILLPPLPVNMVFNSSAKPTAEQLVDDLVSKKDKEG